MSRIPTVLALSGRPPRPAPLHRSATFAVVLLVVGIVCLAIGGRAKNGMSSGELAFVCVGILGVVGGVLLVSPLAVRALAGLAGGAPIAERLALRDLGRYRARSASALAAVALALGLPVVIVATTAAAENQLGAGNLPSNQLLVQQAELDGPFVSKPESIADMQDGIDAIAATLPDAVVLRLDAAVNPNARPDPNVDAVPGISLAAQARRRRVGGPRPRLRRHPRTARPVRVGLGRRRRRGDSDPLRPAARRHGPRRCTTTAAP